MSIVLDVQSEAEIPTKEGIQTQKPSAVLLQPTTVPWDRIKGKSETRYKNRSKPKRYYLHTEVKSSRLPNFIHINKYALKSSPLRVYETDFKQTNYQTGRQTDKCTFQLLQNLLLQFIIIIMIGYRKKVVF